MNHAWIEPELVVARLVQVSASLVGATLQDLTTSTGMWNWNMLEGWLPDEILNKIAAKLPPHADYDEDVRAFAGNDALKCSVPGLYSHICGFGNSIVQDIWRLLWKLNALERVRCFTWLLLHGQILKNMKKRMMGLGHGMCRYCGDVEETVVHVWRDCLLATNIRCYFVTSDNIGWFFSCEVEEWIHNNIKNKERWRRGSYWNDIWAMVCLCVWNWRNKEVHVENFVQPLNPVQFIIRLKEDYDKAVLANTKVLVHDRVLKIIKWTPPVLNTVKVDMNGACQENIIAGCVGVI